MPDRTVAEIIRELEEIIAKLKSTNDPQVQYWLIDAIRSLVRETDRLAEAA